MEAASSPVVDLIEAYAFPLPIGVICELLGIPAEDREKLRYWSSYLLSGDSSSEAEKRMAEFFQYLIALITERRQRLAKTKSNRESDSQDLVGALILAEEAGQNLNEDELLAMIFTLIVAGHETTVNLIGNGVLALLEHPDQLTLLQNNPALVKNTIEELLRYDSPLATSSFRYAAEDVVIGGQKILKGEGILVAVGSANRDSAQYGEADKLDISRPTNPHLAFGQGIHFCLGAPLARLEGQIALSKLLLERFPGMKLAVAVEDLSWRNSMVLRGLQALPVRLG